MFISLGQLIAAYESLGFAVETHSDSEQVSFRHEDGRMMFHATTVREGVHASFVLQDAHRAFGPEFAEELREAIRAAVL